MDLGTGQIEKCPTMTQNHALTRILVPRDSPFKGLAGQKSCVLPNEVSIHAGYERCLFFFLILWTFLTLFFSFK